MDIKNRTLTPAQRAKRDEVAKRAGLPPELLLVPVNLVNDHSGKCLTVRSASTADRAEVIQYECNNGYPDNDVWWFVDMSLGWVQLVNGHSGKCLSIFEASKADYGKAIQYECNNSAPYNDEWYLDDVYGTGGYWHLQNRHSGKCLTIEDASKANYGKAIQYTCNNTAPYNEEWIIW